VGVSVKLPGKKSKYYSWGHVTGNNSTWGEAKQALDHAWACKDGVAFQNGKFDVDVAEVHMKMDPLPWERVHDTLFLLFLDDPHQMELGLKQSASRLLNLPPDEQDDVRDWLLEHQPIPGVRISKAKSSDHYFGRYLAYAPGDLVGKYAEGDTDRAGSIFDMLMPKTLDRGMGGAYDRERRLIPILIEMERQGLPIDAVRLGRDVTTYYDWQRKLDAWVIKTLRADPGINLDSGDQLVEAMVKSGKADPNLMPRTATGRFQTNKDALLLGVVDKQLLAALKYRTQLNTCMNTFMLPWLETAQHGGLIYTTWNQTKTPSGDHNVGTRTGRLSSTPNFQNIPKEFQPIFDHDAPGKKLPKSPLADLPQLPKVRSYITPSEGGVMIDRDYSQQEPRIMAHFEGGSLQQRYLDNPWIDFHDSARDELAKVGKHYARKPVKNTNLGLIYGMGVGKLAMKNDMTVEEASGLKEAILALYPGLKEMYKDMKLRARMGQSIRTWGGREYYCEEPKIVDGRLRHFDYKLVNVLIQGSAADCTKEAIIRFHAAKRKDTRIILNVHDQLTADARKAVWKAEMEVLRQCLESVEFDVPILSEGSFSMTNWDELIDYDKKGKVL
jgi:DNA polymerase-1